MNMHKLIKIAAIGFLSLGLTSCYISAQEEANIAMNKWQGKKINDFFFMHGKGEFQAQNSQGKKAYRWRSPKRSVEIVGQSYIVKVAHKYIPNKLVDKTIYAPSTYKIYQCILRIETSSSGRISLLSNVNKSSECVRYFNLSQAEKDALLEARS